MKLRDNRKKATEGAYSEWLEKSDERLSVLQEDCSRTDKRLSELQYWHPMKRDIDGCKDDIRTLNIQESEYKSNLAIVSGELKSLRQEALMKCEQVEHGYAQRQDLAKKDLEQLQAELAATDDILSRRKGSLYEWLTNNKPGWEENIGKIVDETHVLYAQGLSPVLTSDSGMFGVNLNLDAIPTHHRTPDEYRELQKQQKEVVAAKKKELANLQTEYNNKLEAIRKSYKGKISAKQQEETNVRVQLEQVPQKRKDAETRLHQFESKDEELVKAEREKRTSAYNEACLNRERENNARSLQRTKREKDLKAADSDYNATLNDLQKRFEAYKQKQEAEKQAKQKDINERRQIIKRQEHDELKGKGADTNAIELCRKDIETVSKTLDKIKDQRHYVIEYRKDEAELFSHEKEFRDDKRQFEAKDAQIRQAYEDKRKRIEYDQKEKVTLLNAKTSELESMKEGLKQYEQLCGAENIVPEVFIQDDIVEKNNNSCGDLVISMRGTINKKRQNHDELKRHVNSFNSHFGQGNTFHFVVPQYDNEYLDFALNLQDFVENDKIEDYRERVSEHYNTILRSVSREVGLLMNHSAEIKGIINDVNRDFQERNFAGVIHSIELRADESSDRMMQLLRTIRDFTEENSLSIGEQNLFSGSDRDQVNAKVVDYLKKFMKQLQKEPSRTELTLSDTFRLQFRIQENDNNTGWVERINNVGSDGTDILVKAMVNIMLINVFKMKASRKHGDFIIHCMMDEIGKLHPSNVAGILQFANVRNIYLINSSPMGYNADIYKYNYLLTKDGKSQTHIKRLMTVNA